VQLIGRHVSDIGHVLDGHCRKIPITLKTPQNV
jgi:hypothetical protein